MVTVRQKVLWLYSRSGYTLGAHPSPKGRTPCRVWCRDAYSGGFPGRSQVSLTYTYLLRARHILLSTGSAPCGEDRIKSEWRRHDIYVCIYFVVRDSSLLIDDSICFSLRPRDGRRLGCYFTRLAAGSFRFG